MSGLKRFAILYSPGKRWKADRPFSEQDLEAHGRYMQQLFDAGQLESGGPFTDSQSGLAVILCNSQQEAVAIVENDPAVETEVFSAYLHPRLSVDWARVSTE